jgi:hypothetical protein
MSETTEADEREAREPDQVEHAIYCLLTVRDEQRPWSLHEIGLEIGDELDTHDAVQNLRSAGLVHELGGFVWASRAALAADAMGG